MQGVSHYSWCLAALVEQGSYYLRLRAENEGPQHEMQDCKKLDAPDGHPQFVKPSTSVCYEGFGHAPWPGRNL